VNGLQDETVLSEEPGDIGRITTKERTGARARPVTSRWHLGRLVRVSMEAGCGFIRVPSGEPIYFSMQDVVAGGSGLRAGVRVRFQTAGSGIPRAVRVQRI
jgi:hypothetical protein